MHRNIHRQRDRYRHNTDTHTHREETDKHIHTRTYTYTYTHTHIEHAVASHCERIRTSSSMVFILRIPKATEEDTK